MARFGMGGYCWTARSHLVAAIVCYAWPPVGFLLGETGFLNLHAHGTRKPPDRDPANGETSCPHQYPGQKRAKAGEIND